MLVIKSDVGKTQTNVVLTVPIVIQIEQLVAPLCHNPKSIFEECDND